MRVCYFGTYRKNYSRNRIMIGGLRASGIEVAECHEPLWSGIEDRVDKASGGWASPRFLCRVLRTYARLLHTYRRVGRYDVMIVGYPGYLDVFLAWWLTRARGKPLVLDTFMSMYLVAMERGLVEQSPFTGRVIRLLERNACRLPDLLISDTADYVDYYHQLHGLATERFRLVPTGADDRCFHPVNVSRAQDGQVGLIYYGTFIPNHGTLTIIEAAHLLAERRDIHFELVGRGPDKTAAIALSQRYGLSNVTFLDWIDSEELPYRVAQSDICLGAFGITPQSMMTIQNKVYEGLAMRKPVISGDSPPARHAMTHGEHIWLCERDNPHALAQAISKLASDSNLRDRLAQQGHQLFLQEFSVRAIGTSFSRHLEKLING